MFLWSPLVQFKQRHSLSIFRTNVTIHAAPPLYIPVLPRHNQSFFPNANSANLQRTKSATAFSQTLKRWGLGILLFGLSYVLKHNGQPITTPAPNLQHTLSYHVECVKDVYIFSTPQGLHCHKQNYHLGKQI